MFKSSHRELLTWEVAWMKRHQGDYSEQGKGAKLNTAPGRAQGLDRTLHCGESLQMTYQSMDEYIQF